MINNNIFLNHIDISYNSSKVLFTCSCNRISESRIYLTVCLLLPQRLLHTLYLTLWSTLVHSVLEYDPPEMY